MKKLNLLLIAFALIFNVKVVFAQTSYKPFADVYTMEKDYSNSTLFLSKKTEIKVIKASGSVGTEESSGNYKFYRTNINEGSELIVLITNSAVNKKGELLDAVVKINNVKKFSAADSGYATFGVKSSYTVAKDVSNPTSTNSYTTKNNEPMVLELGTSKATAEINITYYLAGTYKDESNKGNLGNVTGASATIWDFDNVASGTYAAERFAGNEGIVPLNGDALIYYNITPTHKNPSYAYEYKTEDNGIAIKTKQGGNVDSLNYENMVFLKTNITDSTFKLSFGGETGNLFLTFASPYPYNLNMPTKTVDVKEAISGKVFHYNIMQYVPNNYYGTIFGLQKVFDNMYSNTRYTSFKIWETFNKNLEINTKDIKVTNELGEDVTSYFTFTVDSNNKMTGIVNSDTFDKAEFYGHAYNVSVPITLKEDVKEISKITSDKTYVQAIKNNAKLVSQSEDKTSYTVNYKVKYKVTTNYIDYDTKEKIKDSVVEEKDLNEKYITNYKDIDDTKWGLVELPKNYSGTVKENVDVNYYFRKKYKVTVNFYEQGTTNKVAESQVLYYYMGDEYTTNYDNVEKSWEVAETPDNAKGKITGEDIEVNYYFTEVIIENPPTGAIAIPFFLIGLFFIGVIFYKSKVNKKLYKI